MQHTITRLALRWKGWAPARSVSYRWRTVERGKVILAAVLAAITIHITPAEAATSPQLRVQITKGATGLTWLTNPAHAKFGTSKSRNRAYHEQLHLLMGGLKSIGWLDPALCVHRYEGGWNATNGVDDGGMQMDISFQTSYGPVYYNRWGRAYNWPYWAQLHAAFVGWSARGWGPWPNTARYCHLL